MDEEKFVALLDEFEISCGEAERYEVMMVAARTKVAAEHAEVMMGKNLDDAKAARESIMAEWRRLKKLASCRCGSLK